MTATLKVNTIAPILLAQALFNNVATSQQKVIVNTSSMLGSLELNQVGDWFWLAYRVSKSALNAATRCLANQFHSKNIIVIALDPGWVKTDMGGKDAELEPEESIKGIINVVANLKLTDSGNFFKYNGSHLPW